MGAPTGPVYEFGEFTLNAGERLLLRKDSIVSLTPKAFETLLLLVENSGHVLTRDELLETVWRDSFVEENTLTQNVAALRKALGEQSGHQYIETVPKVGYRFVAAVRESGIAKGELLFERRTRERMVIKARESATTDEPTEEAINRQRVGVFERAKAHRALSIAAAALVLIGIAAAVLLLTRSNPVRAGVPIKSIAVLPFKNLDTEESDEYLGIGLADALTTRLGKFKQLIVRPTNSVYKYRALGQDPVAAGRELGVEAVLDGSIHESGDKIRVTMQLVRVSDGAALWTDKFDGKLTDLFAVQDAISNQVSKATALDSMGDEKQLAGKRHTSNIEAYQEYLKGRYFWNKRTAEGFAKSLEHFERAIALDPDYALAYAGIADTRMLYQPGPGIASPKEMAKRALALDETLAEAHTNLAYYQSAWEWKWADAEREFQRAIDLNPSYATAHHWYAYHLACQGRLDEALAEINEALKIDPLSLVISTDVGHMLYLARRYDEAMDQYRKVLDMDPNFSVTHLRLGEVYIQKRMYDEARAELQTSIRLAGRAPAEIAEMGYIHAVSGRRAEAQRVIDELNELSPQHLSLHYCMAMVYAGLADKDRAFKLLEEAYEIGGPVIGLYKVDPLLDPLRSDSRYKDLLQRLGLAQ